MHLVARIALLDVLYEVHQLMLEMRGMLAEIRLLFQLKNQQHEDIHTSIYPSIYKYIHTYHITLYTHI